MAIVQLVEPDINACSVPWRQISETVTVIVSAGTVVLKYGGEEAARHPPLSKPLQPCGRVASMQGWREAAPGAPPG